MVPGIAPVTASESAELSRSVPVQPLVPPVTYGVKPAGTDHADTFQPVRVGPLFEVATSEQDVTVARSDQRVELDAYAERLASDRAADSRALQEKLYLQY